MSNIWEFLLQTATVSLTAGLLLLLKKLFEDKLPPRWQYTIWFLLALRVLLPAATQNRYILLPLPVWIEALKSIAEQNLSASAFGPSLFSAPFDPVHLTSGLPWPAVSAQSTADTCSVTDVLFLIYIAGVLFCLLRYLVNYRQLRRILRQNTCPLSLEMQDQVLEAAKKYSLKTCPVVMVEGLPSAFVCGIFKPVLVLPARTQTDSQEGIDKKILLHELLHLKHHDALQSVFWSLLRALHWCNPFLQYVFNRIGNDMEALCDQRVLERLEGEERREYGRILLEMTNDRYPRAFGTSSLSNGAANIALRIGCIARFKKYPKGMELVSICMALMLMVPLFFGVTTREFNRFQDSPRNYHLAFASARLNRCTTMAGAVDTFYRSLADENSLLLATCSPLHLQYTIREQMDPDFYEDASNGFNYSLPVSLDGWPYDTEKDAYYIYNLRSTGVGEGGTAAEGTAYDAELLIPLKSIGKYSDGLEEFLAAQTPKQRQAVLDFADKHGYANIAGCAVYYLTISEEKNRWVISQRAPRDLYFTGNLGEGFLSCEAYAAFLPETGYGVYKAESETGKVLVRQMTALTVDIDPTKVFSEVNLDADFYWNYDRETVTYTFKGPDDARTSVTEVLLEKRILISPEDAMQEGWWDWDAEISGNAAASGTNHSSRSWEGEPGTWDGTMTALRGGGMTVSHMDPTAQLDAAEPVPAYAVRIKLNGRLTEKLVALPAWTDIPQKEVNAE